MLKDQRVAAALADLQNGVHKSIRAAAKAWNVAPSTLSDRKRVVVSRREARVITNTVPGPRGNAS